MNLQELKNSSITLLGKTRALSMIEFEKLLSLYDIECKSEFDESVSLVIEGRMMSPYHQNEQERLYEKGCRFESIDALEEALCQDINPQTIMMSLKLSNDQERVQSFIQNPYISDEFFLKLIKLYRWNSESFFESDENRNVTAALIRRFYKNIERNHNVEYANTGLAHLLKQTKNSELIDVIGSLEPIVNALKRGSDNATIRILQTIALHPSSSDELLLKMIPFADKELLRFIASREPLSIKLQDKLMKFDELKDILSCNSSLDILHVKELLKDADARELILLHVKLDRELFDSYIDEYAEILAHNENLTKEMIESLNQLKSTKVDSALAKNPAITEELKEEFLDSKDEDILNSLAQNSTLSEQKLELLSKNESLHVSIASNENCSQELLGSLSHSANPDVISALAKNPSTPVDILFQLQLDARYERAVHENPAFGKHIQRQNIGWL
jgi:hypothetical protein